MAQHVAIDRRKHLAEEPKTGHNRWHPDIRPILEVKEGEDVALETRDAADGYLHPGTTVADMAAFPPGAIHPLTGPVLVKGARPGDLLEVEFVDIVPERHAFSCILPGLGFLRDVIATPFLVHWEIADGWASSPQLPKVRIPGGPFMGVSGVAPSGTQLEAWTRREADLLARGGLVFPPDAAGAVPASGPAAAQGLRTIPPRENGGNFDVKQLTRGARLFLPVGVEGALFSTGDGHGVQGDGEVNLTALETCLSGTFEFHLHKKRALKLPRAVTPSHYITMAFDPDLDDAAKDALRAMIQLLGEVAGMKPEDAYAFCSLACDLRVTQTVDGHKGIHAMVLRERIRDILGKEPPPPLGQAR